MSNPEGRGDMRRKPGQLIFSGEPGDSLFTEPLPGYTEMLDSNAEVPFLFKRLQSAGDDRSYVVLATLVVEHHLNRLLTLYIPGYERLSNDRDFTLSMKTKLLQGCNLIPPHILRCADCIRRVRNGFAHDLGIDSLDKLRSQDRGLVKSLCDEIYGRTEISGKSTRELIEKVCFIAIAGIRCYERNGTLLQEVIKTAKFQQNLVRRNEADQQPLYDTIVSKPPHETLIEAGVKVERFEGGIVRVTSLPGDESSSQQQ